MQHTTVHLRFIFTVFILTWKETVRKSYSKKIANQHYRYSIHISFGDHFGRVSNCWHFWRIDANTIEHTCEWFKFVYSFAFGVFRWIEKYKDKDKPFVHLCVCKFWIQYIDWLLLFTSESTKVKVIRDPLVLFIWNHLKIG